MIRSFFNDISIQQKIVLVIVFSSFVAMFLTGAGLVAYDLVAFRNEKVRGLKILAEVIGKNSTAAIT